MNSVSDKFVYYGRNTFPTCEWSKVNEDCFDRYTINPRSRLAFLRDVESTKPPCQCISVVIELVLFHVNVLYEVPMWFLNVRDTSQPEPLAVILCARSNGDLRVNIVVEVRIVEHHYFSISRHSIAIRSFEKSDHLLSTRGWCGKRTRRWCTVAARCWRRCVGVGCNSHLFMQFVAHVRERLRLLISKHFQFLWVSRLCGRFFHGVEWQLFG